MLRYLRISHLAVIDKAEVEFEPGFNVLTGETGAGKSILVEAVGLLLGGRASAELVRTGGDAARAVGAPDRIARPARASDASRSRDAPRPDRLVRATGLAHRAGRGRV